MRFNAANITFCGAIFVSTLTLNGAANSNPFDAINNIAGTVANVAGAAAAVSGAVPVGSPDGGEYCFYPDGWHGAGYYTCGFAYREGLGWGGPRGWRGGENVRFRDGRGHGGGHGGGGFHAAGSHGGAHVAAHSAPHGAAHH